MPDLAFELMMIMNTGVRLLAELTVSSSSGSHYDKKDRCGDKLMLHVNARQSRTGMRVRWITRAQLLPDILLSKRM